MNAHVIPLTKALRILRTHPTCLLCGNRLTPMEREHYTSFCEDDVPGLMIRFEERDQELRSG